MALPVLSLVVRALSQQFPEMAEAVPNYLKKELGPVVLELRKAFNSLKGPSYNFGTLIYGDGPPVGAPSADRALYIDRLGAAGTILYDWNGAAWELVSGGGSGGSLAIQDEGVPKGNATTMNFVGTGVTASVAASTATVTVPSLSPATTVVTETAFGQAPSVGAATTYAREDHTHGTPAAPAGGTPASTVTDGTLFSVLKVVGVSLNFAREDHKHGTPPIFQSSHDFGGGGIDSITQTVSDVNVTGNAQFVGGIRPASGRDLDEMELGPVTWAVGNIVPNVSFDVIAVSLDNTATGVYVVDVVRHAAP